jgi:hypothetical protein
VPGGAADGANFGLFPIALRFQLLQEHLDLLLEDRDVLLYGSPYLMQVYSEVFVNQDISHGDNLRPRDIRVSVVKGAAQLRRRFTNNL